MTSRKRAFSIKPELPKSAAAPIAGFLKNSMVDRTNLFFRFRRYIKMIHRRWLILVVFTVIGVGYASYKAFTSPDVYRASSRIGIAGKVVSSSTPQAQYLEELSSFYERNIEYMNAIQNRVAQKAATLPGSSPPARLLSARASKSGSSFLMLVDSTTAAYSRGFARLWADEFLEFKNSMSDTAVAKNVKFTQEEIKRYEKKLETARADLNQFRTTNNIGSAKELRSSSQNRLDTLLDEQQSIITMRRRLEGTTKEDIARSGGVPDAARPPREKPDEKPVVAPSSDPLEKFDLGSRYTDYKLRLKEKIDERDARLATLKPKHPMMIQLNADVQRLQKSLSNELEIIEEKRTARISSLKDQERSIEPIIAELKDKVRESGNIVYAFDRLEEDVTNIKNTLETLKKQLQTLDLPVDEVKFDVLEAGVGPDKPVAPNRPKNILLGLLLGMAAGIVLIYFLDRLDDRLELAEEIEAALEEPVLGQIPLIDETFGGGENLLITKVGEHRMFMESFRGVRSAIMLGSTVGQNQTLIVTSAIPGDGKTTFTVNFALTLATSGHRVLLIDADLRRGNINKYFGHPRDPGLADILAGKVHWHDVLNDTPIQTLKAIHSGALPANPGELLNSPITRQLVEEAREDYDYIIFDCPPLTAIDDTFALVGLSNGILFVVRSGQTSMRFAKNALAAVRQRGAEILGVILNGITADNPYYYYSSYYHSYYSAVEPPGPVAAPPVPAVSMPEPKVRRRKANSIVAEAKAQDGVVPSSASLAAEEQAKAKQFRARRSQKSSKKTAPPPTDPSSNPPPSPPPSDQAHLIL